MAATRFGLSTDGGLAALHDLPGVDRIRDLGQIQELHMAPGCDPQRVLHTLVSRTAVTSFNIMRPCLHDIFVRIAGPTAVEEEDAQVLRRILLIAKRDFTSAVMTKAFVIGLVVLPLLLGSGFLGFALLRVTQGETAKRIAIVDHTGMAAAADHPGRGSKNGRGKSRPEPVRSNWFRRAMCSRKLGADDPLAVFQTGCGVTN